MTVISYADYKTARPKNDLEKSGGGDDSGGMEARVAVLEQIAKQTEGVLERMDRRLERLEDRQRTDFLWLLGVMLGGFAGIFGLMAHGFHWF